MTGFYRGVPLEDMTKEQLIDAICEMHNMMEADRNWYMKRIEYCLGVEQESVDHNRSTNRSSSLLAALKRLINRS